MAKVCELSLSRLDILRGIFFTSKFYILYSFNSQLCKKVLTFYVFWIFLKWIQKLVMFLTSIQQMQPTLQEGEGFLANLNQKQQQRFEFLAGFA